MKAVKTEVTIIGLGNMGIKLAGLLVQQQRVITVWNRTTEKAKQLANTTAPNNKIFFAENLDLAFAASPLIVICVQDYIAVNQILDQLTDQAAIFGKTIINLTTDSPAEAENLENRLAQMGVAYLSGAIQVAPDQMGLTNTTILLSGAETAFKQHQPVLRIFGGNSKYLGEKAALSSAMDLATLTWLYGSYFGLLHGVALCQSAGLKLEAFSNIMAEIIPGFTQFFQHEIAVIEKGQFAVSQSPLSISVDATQRILAASIAYQHNSLFPKVMADTLLTAGKLDLGNQELAVLIKLVRSVDFKSAAGNIPENSVH